MNFPFELIFIVLFLVLPALGGLLGRLRGQPPPTGQAPKRQAQGANRSPTRAGTSTADTGEARTNTEVPRWLEEAQRRVREAQQNEPNRRGGRRGTQAGQPSSTPRPLVSRQPPRSQNPSSRSAQTSQSSLEDYRPKPVSLETPAREVRSSARQRAPAQTPAAPLRVQRIGNAKGATLSSYTMRFDKPTLMTGFVWHQILSPPLSQSRRTRLSRRRP